MRNFKIIGKGNTGDKAKQLIKKTSKLEKIGFYAPKRNILSQSFFEKYLQHNNIAKNLNEVSNENIENIIQNGSFSKDQYNTIKKLLKRTPGEFIAIRSSACGDSRGTGIYKTIMKQKNVGLISNAIKNVFASYFTQDAIEFRKHSNSEQGFGEIIEPVIGQWLSNSFAPIYSGHGYTSTPNSGGWIKIVNGLGGGVEDANALKIDKAELEKNGYSLGSYISNNLLHNHITIQEIPYEYYKKEKITQDGIFKHGNRFELNRETNLWETKEGKIFFKSSNGDKIILNNIDYTSLFEKMAEMEKKFKEPQYFEFAIIGGNFKELQYITQISNINKKDEFNEIPETTEAILVAKDVLGSGKRKLEKIVVCSCESSVNTLREFNKYNDNYGVIYSGKLTHKKDISFSDISNSSVLLEHPYMIHIGSALSHWEGTLEETKKFFGVLKKGDTDNLGKPHYYELKGNEIIIYKGNFEVVANEKHDILVVKNKSK